MKSIALGSMLLLSAMFVPAQAAGRNAPAHFSSIDEIRAWAEAGRGFGVPESVDFDLVGIRLFVTSNRPFSGRSGVFSDAYHFNKAEGKWRLIDSNVFEENGVLSHVYVDANTNELVYVDQDGEAMKRFPLKDYTFK